MNTRILDNQTNLSLQITLFIQAGNNLRDLHGTINVDLLPGEAKSVSYGDLRNCFLSGLKLSPLPYDSTDSYYCRVYHRTDTIDNWLNNSNTIEITANRIAKLESSGPFQKAN